MPRPPNIDGLAQLNFITNYFIQGCAPPFWAYAEFAREPGGELLGLLFGFDAEDIAQAIFEPRGRREPRKERRGKKRRRRPGFPDVNDMVGRGVRGAVNPFDAFRGPNATTVFRVNNIYEGFSFGVALVEVLTEGTFDATLGWMLSNRQNCPGAAFMTRSAIGEVPTVGVAPAGICIPLGNLENIQNFASSSGCSWNHFGSDYRVAISGEVRAISAGGLVNCRYQLRGVGGGIFAESSPINLPNGGTQSWMLSGKVPDGVATYLTRQQDFGSIGTFNCTAFAFASKW